MFNLLQFNNTHSSSRYVYKTSSYEFHELSSPHHNVFHIHFLIFVYFPNRYLHEQLYAFQISITT